MLGSLLSDLNGWSTTAADLLSSFSANKKDSERAMRALQERIRQQEEARSEEAATSGLSDNVIRELTSCQAATTEFLRQFWAAVAPLPPPPPAPASAGTIKAEGQPPEEETRKPLTPAQRRGRAKRMLELLRNSGERGDNVARIAETERPGAGAKRVKLALQATDRAVERAIKIGDAMYGKAPAPAQTPA